MPLTMFCFTQGIRGLYIIIIIVVCNCCCWLLEVLLAVWSVCMGVLIVVVLIVFVIITKNLKSGAYRRMFTIVQNQLLFKTSETMEIL